MTGELEVKSRERFEIELGLICEESFFEALGPDLAAKIKAGAYHLFCRGIAFGATEIINSVMSDLKEKGVKSND